MLAELFVYGGFLAMAGGFYFLWRRDRAIERGDWHFRNGRHEEARSWYDRALRFAPRYAPAHEAKGWLLHELKDTAGALAALETAVACDPRYAPGYYAMGVVLYERGDEGAAAMFEKALATHRILFWGQELTAGHRYEALMGRGRVLSHSGRHEEALESLRAARCLRPKWPPVYLEMAMALARKGDRQAAVTAALRYLDLTRGDPTWNGRVPWAADVVRQLGAATELEAAEPPAGWGSELEAAPPPPGSWGVEGRLAAPPEEPPQHGRTEQA